MSIQIATFLLGDAYLGLDILLVKEIYRSAAITPVPDAPEHLRGLMNLRGRVVSVMDLNVCLGRPASEKKDENRLLILKVDDEIIPYKNKGLLEGIELGGDIVGFMIDDMDNVIEVEDGEILPPPPNLETVEQNLIWGVIKRGDDLVILLDVTAVFEKVMSIIGG